MPIHSPALSLVKAPVPPCQYACDGSEPDRPVYQMVQLCDQQMQGCAGPWRRWLFILLRVQPALVVIPWQGMPSSCTRSEAGCLRCIMPVVGRVSVGSVLSPGIWSHTTAEADRHCCCAWNYSCIEGHRYINSLGYIIQRWAGPPYHDPKRPAGHPAASQVRKSNLLKCHRLCLKMPVTPNRLFNYRTPSTTENKLAKDVSQTVGKVLTDTASAYHQEHQHTS